jgi:uncharacterized protein with WD repeat
MVTQLKAKRSVNFNPGVYHCNVLAATTVPLPKEGPVHDVQWSPKGDFFLTVAGFMPAKVREACLHNRDVVWRHPADPVRLCRA